MEQLIWTLLGAILGAIFSLIAYVFYESYLLIKQRQDLFTTWKSSWQPTLTKEFEWIEEDLTISRRWGKIFLKSANNSGGFEWEGNAKLIKNELLCGEWYSTKPNSNVKGTFALEFGFDGQYMIGFLFTSDIPEKSKVATGFVLGKTVEALGTGRKRLQETQPQLNAPVVNFFNQNLSNIEQELKKNQVQEL
jgi:hypothetical protein